MPKKTNLPATLPGGKELVEETRGSGDMSRLKDVLLRAEKGDAAALEVAKEVLDHSPGLTAAYGDLQVRAETTLIECASQGNPVAKEALKREIRRLENELLGPNPSALERLLVQRVSLCWLRMGYADAMEAQAVKQGGTFAQGDHYARQAERAQRRFHLAVKSLATVRRLALPAVQVNVANQQIVANGRP